MQVWRSLDDVDVARTVATVGNFDGVHRGHQLVVDGLVRRARETIDSPVVVTFDPHPMTVLRPEAAPLRLTSLARRVDLLGDVGVEAVVVLAFTRELSAWSPDDFVRRVLVDALHAQEVHVGDNFRYGHKAAGTADTLRAAGEVAGFTVRALSVAGVSETWSSSAIRAAVLDGDTIAAAAALGRPHRVEGPVVVGDKRGRALGYPTANLALDADVAIPADGVYAGWLVRADGARLPAAVSIGTNPTFGGTVRRVEAYALDRDDLELYGEHVGVEFADRLRDTVTFDGVEPLLAQMAVDVAQARDIVG